MNKKLHLQHRGKGCECRKTGYWWASFLAVLLFPFELGGGGYYWSLALLADSWHVLTHLPFYAVAIYAFSREDKTRYSLLMANMLLVVALMGIAFAPARFLLPEVHPEGTLVVSTIGLLVNAVMFLIAHFMGDDGEDDHIHEGVWLHIFGDTAMSLAVVGSAVLMLTDLPIPHKGIDAAAALLVNLYLLRQAKNLKNKAIHHHHGGHHDDHHH